MAAFQPTDYQDAFTRLNGETARIPWRTLEPWFAKGDTLQVDATLDLVAVAASLATDDAARVRGWLDSALLQSVPVEQAARWQQQDTEVWAVVVLPWILVQHKA